MTTEFQEMMTESQGMMTESKGVMTESQGMMTDFPETMTEMETVVIKIALIDQVKIFVHRALLLTTFDSLTTKTGF